MTEAAQFLLDRLDEFDPGEDEPEREYHGHVTPAIARLRSAITDAVPQAAPVPVGWRYQGRVGWGDVWRLSEVDPTQHEGFFASPEGWIVEPLYSVTHPAQAAREGLATELMAFHDACSMDAAGGDGQFRILCSSGSSEQAMALRAVLREAAAALSLTRPQRGPQ